MPFILAGDGVAASDRQVNEIGAAVLLVMLVLVAPTLETLLECSLPYWVLRRWSSSALAGRAWSFVAVSAALMALLHVGAWPVAIVPSLVTGAFLAYTYAHFAPRSQAVAFAHAAGFHAAINLVGWTLIMVS